MKGKVEMEEKTPEYGSIKALVDFLHEQQWSVSYLRSVVALLQDNECDALVRGGVAVLGGATPVFPK